MAEQSGRVCQARAGLQRKLRAVAVFEEKTSSDGYSFGTMAKLDADKTYTFIFRGNADACDRLYFTLNVEGGTSVVLYHDGMAYNGDQMFYVDSPGNKTLVMPGGNSIVFEEDGYFYVNFEHVWVSIPHEIWYSVLSG